MKNILIAISSFTLTALSIAQQNEHLTQYQFNQFNFNPAVAGTKKCIDIRSGYRFQWLGIDGAPETGFINAHGPLVFNKRKRNLFGPKNGIGLAINRDRFGSFSFLQAHLSYALHLPLNKDWTLSFGTSLGVKQAAFRASELTTEFDDPVLPNTVQSFTIFPDLRFGTWLAHKKHYFGFSIFNLLGNQLDQISTDSRFERHFYLTAGKQFKLEKSWTFVPSFFVLKTKNTPLDFHLSALFNLDNKFSIGAGIRRTDAITAQIRFKLFNFLSIGYSFDYVISKLNRDMWQTHEITAGFNSCSNYGNSSTTSCATFE
ncbi:PorP/SprF family type IX secretion system membrane protein [Crocinitomix algicola]|uniref:PorP/SprF family type IX secretion system membrane protein n=1 Tax=Crocinitomix algicola TaxID=1740263 RepID=UPI00082BED48|nr:type IX secretion system membrane protein PorP/SprF [Crocinitomix algicola]